VAVWDLPTRLFHWALVGLVIGAWLSATFGDLTLQWHRWNGYAVLVLVVFRIGWGFWGAPTARFAQFVRGFRAVRDYLVHTWRGDGPAYYHGHNPAGGWSVMAMLAVVASQAISGLFTSDDILASGPLASLLSDRLVAQFSTLHRLGFLALLALIVLHLGAILFYRLVKRENLVRPMLTGYRAGSPCEQPVMATTTASLTRALWTLAGSMLLVWAGMRLAAIILD
jgi:cytochrome b